MRWTNLKSFLVFLFGFLPLAYGANGSIIYLNPANALELIRNNQAVNIIDIRTDEEFNQGHLANAQNIDYLKPEFEEQINRLNSNAEYLFYCRSGARTQQALDILGKKQFTKLYILQGGIMSWQRFGNPVVR
ncbi:MAG: rhodanese-like domain-containing protein [Candidatus Margulisbacteria bacterium]|nr:rhodanese-like domain-containing protein [Candidatus Margulisiibacteriota bacterium]